MDVFSFFVVELGIGLMNTVINAIISFVATLLGTG